MPFYMVTNYSVVTDHLAEDKANDFEHVEQANEFVAGLPSGTAWSIQAITRSPGRVSVRLVAKGLAK